MVCMETEVWGFIFIFAAFPTAGACSQAMQVQQCGAWIWGSEMEELFHIFIYVYSS